MAIGNAHPRATTPPPIKGWRRGVETVPALAAPHPARAHTMMAPHAAVISMPVGGTVHGPPGLVCAFADFLAGHMGIMSDDLTCLVGVLTYGLVIFLVALRR